MMILRHGLFLTLAVAVVACQNEAETPAEPAVDIAPPSFALESVTVSAAQVAVAGSVERKFPTRFVDGFRLGRTVVTQGQYAECVAQGVCAPGADAGLVSENEANIPVDQVTPEDALAFCEWTGGRLPSAAEWLLGARGPDNRAYPWEQDEPPSCAQHTRANGRCCIRNNDCDSVERHEVLKHAPGASSFGVEDVLMTEAELVAGEASGRCDGRGCYLWGRAAGRIDVLAPYPDQGEIARKAGFRCAWND